MSLVFLNSTKINSTLPSLHPQPIPKDFYSSPRKVNFRNRLLLRYCSLPIDLSYQIPKITVSDTDDQNNGNFLYLVEKSEFLKKSHYYPSLLKRKIEFTCICFITGTERFS